MSAPDIAANLLEVRERIASAARRAGRDPADVRLVAVSKLQPVQSLAAAIDAGQLDLGENYANELETKAAVLDRAVWHFLGVIQRRSAAKVAAIADWVHGCVPGEPLDRLANRAAERGRSIGCLIQVDLAGRGTGVVPDRIEEAAEDITQRAGAGVTLEGLMTIPPVEAVGEAARPYFEHLTVLGEQLRSAYPRAVELSMGMSSDYEIAVEEGATIVRVGTAVFGERAAVQRP